MERQPIPGTQPGMADHAPTRVVAAGAGPGAEHRFFATFELEAENTAYCAQNLRFAGAGGPGGWVQRGEAQRKPRWLAEVSMVWRWRAAGR